MLDGVEPDHLVAALRGGVCLGDERGRVVARALGLAGAAGRRAGVLGRQPDRHRLDAAREVRAGGRGDEQVGVAFAGRTPEPTSVEIMNGRRYSDWSGSSGTQALSTSTSARSDSMNSSSGSSAIASRLRGVGEPRGVRVGPERRDRAVGLAVGLEPFEDLLAVVQRRRRRVERERTVGQTCPSPQPSSAVQSMRTMWSVKYVPKPGRPGSPRAPRRCAGSGCATR